VAYDPTVFADVPEGGIPLPGTPDLDAAEFNKIGTGIKDAHDLLAAKVDPEDLAEVATSGSYTDLIDKPTIPAAYSDEQARNAVGNALRAGTNVTITTDDAANTITIATADDAVDSVNGETGAVTLGLADLTDVTTTGAAVGDVIAFTQVTPAAAFGKKTLAKADVGLGSVDNTSDAAKPVSTATQAALDAMGGLAAASTWTGLQRFTSTAGGGQTAASGTYLSSGSGNPGIEFANGTSNWRIDNSGGELRFLEASVAVVATLDFGGKLSTSYVQTDRLAVGSTSSPRHVVPIAVTMDGSTFNGSTPLADKVAHPLTVVFKGGFSAESGYVLDNPGWLWGANDFVITGQASGDLAGIADLMARLTEVHCNAPGAALNTLTGLQAEAAINAEAVGATAGNVHSLRVIRPRIRGGTATNAYGLFITAAEITGSGSITGNNISLFVDGPTQLDGTLTLSSITSTSSATAGVASALPATPQGYITVNINGTNRKIPYYV
jgi:hypothetical protein